MLILIIRAPAPLSSSAIVFDSASSPATMISRCMTSRIGRESGCSVRSLTRSISGFRSSRGTDDIVFMIRPWLRVVRHEYSHLC